MAEFNLAGQWVVKEQPLAVGRNDYGRVINNPDGWMPAVVPGDVSLDLIAAGRLKEPLLGLNSMDQDWVEDRSWWYKTTFAFQDGWQTADSLELELDGLDVMADIFLNEVYLGRHPSAFRPFTQDVKEIMVKGNNTLVIRLTSGLERINRETVDPLYPYIAVARASERRGDHRRVMLRKAQYSFGWDWNPRVATCGITGGAKIRALKTGVIRDVHLDTKSIGKEKATVEAVVELELLDWIGTGEGRVELILTDPHGKEQRLRQDVLLRSGFNRCLFSLAVDKPQLWWPNGMGDQPLYTLVAEAEVGGYRLTSVPKQVGLRTVELIEDKLDEQQRLFAVAVNGVRCYCRGANWVPADSIYARVSPEKYEKLVEEAATANFNMLRVWGGGLYEPDCFYQACDRAGILVWQDFMFACAPYPDDQEWFVDEVKKEVSHQVVRLRNHPCLVLWCGNNENHWGFLDWWKQQTKGGARLYNDVIPRIVADKSPSIPYWNSSPYGGEHPNCAEVGDRHHWHDCMMNPEMDKRISPEEYDKVDPKFVSEYGYVGPCCRQTTLRYLDGEPFRRDGKAWQHHNNTFEKGTVTAGIEKHYRSLEGMTDEEYLLYAGLCQGLMYEYSLDSFRRRANNSGALFWMYNDCWGEVGWSVVDYYLRRKISYHFVRRANAPVRLILRYSQEQVQVMLANDSPQAIAEKLEWGYLSFDGSQQRLASVPVKVAPFSRMVVHSFPVGDNDLETGCLMARLVNRADVLPGLYRAMDFRRLQLSDPGLQVVNCRIDGEKMNLTVRSQRFAHAVYFDLPQDSSVSDEYFDLLPGEERAVTVEGSDLQQIEPSVKSILI